MTTPLQLDTWIDQQLGIDPSVEPQEMVTARRGPGELEQLVRVIVDDAWSLPAFERKQAIRSEIMARAAAASQRTAGRGRARRRGRQMVAIAMCALLSTTGAAFAGVLPDSVQKVVARAAHTVGIDVPEPATDRKPVRRELPATVAPVLRPDVVRPAAPPAERNAGKPAAETPRRLRQGQDDAEADHEEIERPEPREIDEPDEVEPPEKAEEAEEDESREDGGEQDD